MPNNGTRDVTLPIVSAPKKPAKRPPGEPPAPHAPPQTEGHHFRGGLDALPAKLAPPTIRIVIHHVLIEGSAKPIRSIEQLPEGQPPDFEIVLPEGAGFADVGREASRAAQRAALLAALAARSWNLSAVARELKITDTSAVIRALKSLAPDEYEAAKKDGRIAPGRRKNS